VFEAYLDLLPPALTGSLPQRQKRRAPAVADGYAGLPPLRSGRDQLAEVQTHGKPWLSWRSPLLQDYEVTIVDHSTFCYMQVMVGLVQAAPFWERGEDWLACRAAVLASLQTAVSGSAFARLLWLVEVLHYPALILLALPRSLWPARFRGQLVPTYLSTSRAFVSDRLLSNANFFVEASSVL
jgi:hypothetical protein